MNAFNRTFAALVGLIWMAAWAGGLYLMWTPSRDIDISNRYLNFVFDISVSGADRIVATIIAAGAIAIGFGLVAAQMMPSRRERVDQRRVAAGDERYRDLQQRLDALQRRVDERERRPTSPAEPAPERVSERR